MLFRDRHEAGKSLAAALADYRGKDAIVLGLPRGGVVVGYEVAVALHLPLDVVITRKVGAPGNPEYALGAVSENGERVLNEMEIQAYGIPQSYVDGEILRQEEEIRRRRVLYRDGRGLLALGGKQVIVVDDGVATGLTTAAALKAVQREGPRELVLAVPVGPVETIQWLSRIADKVICLATPEPFLAVGRFYENFDQVSDEMVRNYLETARGRERALGQS